jgi:hypothetical protein
MPVVAKSAGRLFRWNCQRWNYRQVETCRMKSAPARSRRAGPDPAWVPEPAREPGPAPVAIPPRALPSARRQRPRSGGSWSRLPARRQEPGRSPLGERSLVGPAVAIPPVILRFRPLELGFRRFETAPRAQLRPGRDPGEARLGVSPRPAASGWRARSGDPSRRARREPDPGGSRERGVRARLAAPASHRGAPPGRRLVLVQAGATRLRSRSPPRRFAAASVRVVLRARLPFLPK